MYNLTNTIQGNEVMIGIDTSTINQLIEQTNNNIKYLHSLGISFDIKKAKKMAVDYTEGSQLMIAGYKKEDTDTKQIKALEQKKSVSKVVSTNKEKTANRGHIEAQKKQMKILDKTIENKSPVKYMKANTIANKAVALKFGFEKSIKKSDMTEAMLEFRDIILEKITALMIAKDMGIVEHVSKLIYASIK